MALDLSPERLDTRIDSLRSGWSGWNNMLTARNTVYLRAFSPEFNSDLGEHDQWADAVKQSDDGHFRSSFNLTRAVVELWASLEASEFPAVRWQEAFVPTPVPTLDPVLNEQRDTLYQLRKETARQVGTMREQVLGRQVRLAKLSRGYFRATMRKNVFGVGWVKLTPDTRRQRFKVNAKLDPSTVYPVWSAWEEDELDAVLVAYRKSAQSANEQFPNIIPLEENGLTIPEESYYQPTAKPVADADRAFVWVEDYWVIDRTYEGEADGAPVRSRVVNAIRVNGKMARVTEFKGWTRIPYFPFIADNLRDHTGFSDAATMLPFQDATNRFLSAQADVIDGESKPKFKFRGDSDRQVSLEGEEVIPLDPDEDIEQIAVNLNVFPTQVHGQQLMDLLGRVLGLPDTAWGRIVASQNSGRALTQAWRAVASRLVPRLFDASDPLEHMLEFMLDVMELYGWSDSQELYNGNRDFELDFPNKEPRDFTEVATVAINKMNAGLLDHPGAMEETDERSPDQMLERVKLEYQDVVLYPEKKQAQLLIARLEQELQLQAQQAAQQAQQAAQQQALANQQAAAQQAQAQAAAQRAPSLTEGQNAPATQAGAPANAGKPGYASTLVQGGQAFSRIVSPQIPIP